MAEMRGERLQVMLSPEELVALDDFRFRHRMPTRAAAVRELLKLGLAATGIDAGVGVKSSIMASTVAVPAVSRIRNPKTQTEPCGPPPHHFKLAVPRPPRPV